MRLQRQGVQREEQGLGDRIHPRRTIHRTCRHAHHRLASGTSPERALRPRLAGGGRRPGTVVAGAVGTAWAGWGPWWEAGNGQPEPGGRAGAAVGAGRVAGRGVRGHPGAGAVDVRGSDGAAGGRDPRPGRDGPGAGARGRVGGRGDPARLPRRTRGVDGGAGVLGLRLRPAGVLDAGHAAVPRLHRRAGPVRVRPAPGRGGSATRPGTQTGSPTRRHGRASRSSA